jgi:hypothetical protein
MNAGIHPGKTTPERIKRKKLPLSANDKKGLERLLNLTGNRTFRSNSIMDFFDNRIYKTGGKR